jgi:D-alanyl-D-alanine endopeptidase (penicillin-binding protein 7)
MTMHMLIGQLGWTLLHFVWQGALIAAVAGIGMVALRNARPQARYALACTALFACLLWPALDFALRLQSVVAAPVGAAAMFSGRAAAAQAPAALGWLYSHLQAQLHPLVFGWAACALALSLRMAVGLLWIGRVAGGARVSPDWQAKVGAMAVQFGITRTVRLRIVEGIASPLTAGWWRPVLLLPSSLLTGMPPELLEALIAHELGHVKRCDYLVNLVQNVIETLLFYHPAVWWISRCVRREREQIADDLAANHLGEPRRLALALSELEKIQFSNNKLALAANGGDLMTRIKRLLRPDAQALNWKAALPVLGLAAALFAASVQVPAVAKPEPVKTRALANFKTCAKPLWPKQSLRDENQGAVNLAFLIGTDGKVLDSKVVKSSGFAPLDEAAREGIQKCTFIPATADGAPVQTWMQMQYVWTLK